MNMAEALRSISEDLLEYIQTKVEVDYNNARQGPVSFLYHGETHRIDEILGRFRIWKTHPVNGFLVSSADGEVYFLYFQPRNQTLFKSVQAGFWVLSFRILKDMELMAFYREDRKMLIGATFKRVVDFHGHICPDLVIGGKACEYAQKILFKGNEFYGGVSVFAENCTSALDAIQILLGATSGNQRLRVMDFGKHNYTFMGKDGYDSFRLSLRSQQYGDEDEYNRLERAIMMDQTTMDEVVRFQDLLDGRVKRLLALSPEELFEVKCIDPVPKPTETASVYLNCCKCGEQTLESRIIDYQGKTYCITCFQRMNIDCMYHCLQ